MKLSEPTPDVVSLSETPARLRRSLRKKVATRLRNAAASVRELARVGTSRLRAGAQVS